MIFKFNKLSAFITLGCLSASALAFSAPPPGNEIMNISLRIDNNEGTIYANGNMQAQLYVQYELVEGARLKEITILNRNSRQPLQDSPNWFVDRSENEYLHVISYDSRSSTELPTSKTSDVVTRYRYVRAGQVDNVDLCVRIETESGSVKDNCENGAPVYLQAIAPVVIDSSDFELVHVKNIISDSERHMEQKYIKVRDPRLAVGLKIEGTAPDDYNDKIYRLSSYHNAIRDYQLWQPISNYVGAWLFKPNDFNKILYSTTSGGVLVDLLHSNDASIIAEVIHYEVHQYRFLALGLECMERDSYYYCTKGYYESGTQWMPGYYIDPAMKDKLPNTEPSSKVNVTDQYGNQGYFILDYPNGGDDLVLR